LSGNENRAKIDVMTPFNNTRRHRRFAVDLMHIEGKAVFTCAAAVENLSVSGVSLLTDRVLVKGSSYALNITDDGMDFTLQGTVKWCAEHNPAVRPPGQAHLKYAAGLQFADLDQETVTSLTRFIEKHIIDKHAPVKIHGVSGIRCNIRFDLDHQETAMLDVPETYGVRKLSLGGMLIDSARDLAPDTRLHMEITLPGNARIDFVGRVASCAPSAERPGHFEIGIEFKNMPEQDKLQLKEFIRRLYLEDAGFLTIK